jgi:hypothetical protein
MRISYTFFKKTDMGFLFFCLPVRQLKQTAMKGNWAEARGDGIPFRPGCSDGLYLFADVRAWALYMFVKEMESHGDRPNEIESCRNKLLCSRVLAQFPFIAVYFS